MLAVINFVRHSIGSLYYPRIVTAILWLEEQAAGQQQAEAAMLPRK